MQFLIKEGWQLNSNEKVVKAILKKASKDARDRVTLH